MKLILASLACALSLSCVKRSETSGKIKYAQMDSFDGFGFAELLPNQSVSVCDESGASAAVPLVQKAILDWAGAIGRDKYIKVNPGCGAGDFKVSLTTADANGECQGSVAAYTFPQGKGQFKIVYCSDEHVRSVAINLHEIGHQWMQCDRYSDKADLSQASFGDGCSSTNTDGKELPSAMMGATSSHPQKITEDDVNAMRALAKRQDIPQNTQWTNFQNLNQAPGTNPSQNSTNPSQPTQMGAAATQQQTCAQLTQRLQYESRYRALTQQEYVALALCGANSLADQLSNGNNQPSGS